MDDLKKINKQFLMVLLINALMLAAHAEDIDIFLGTGDIPEGARPNVLFILDNSTSMASPLANTGKSRMQTMKESFTEVINSVTGVNVGFMRFNAPGGSIAYPVRNIDDIVAGAVVTTPALLESSDDAVEFAGDNSVALDGDSLHFGTTIRPASLTTERTIRVSVDTAQSEERSSNGQARGVPTAFTFDGNSRLGLQFSNLGIPSNATINEARLVFTSNSRSSGAVSYKIFAEGVVSAAPFSFTNRELEGRMLTSLGATAQWTISDDWGLDVEYRSEDFSTVLQQIIQQLGWADNNTVTLIFDYVGGASNRAVYMLPSGAPTETEIDRAPELFVRYTTTAAPREAINTVGLRFSNVTVPAGATVRRAVLNFHSAENTAVTSSYTLRVENSDNSETFTGESGSVSSRTKHADTVTWSVNDDWTLDQPVVGPDITSLVQRVVNDNADWCGNNAMTFFITPNDSTSSRYVYSVDHSDDMAPTLDIEFEPNGGCVNDYYSAATASTEDDAVEGVSNRNVDNNSDRAYISANQMVALRFRTLPISQGANIQEAYLDLTAYPYGEDGFASPAQESNVGPVTITIKGEASDNSLGIPESRGNISGRDLTTAEVSWSPDDWSGRTSYRTPDLSGILNEIFRRAGWQEGNSATFVLTVSGSDGRGIMTWDGGAGYAPQLTMKIASGGFDASNNTSRTYLNAAINSLEPRTWSPLVDSFYEAALYFRGDEVFYGQARGIFDQRQGQTEQRYKRISVPESWAGGGSHVLPAGCLVSDSNATACESEAISGFTPGGAMATNKYISPISNGCQSNHIVILTDGHTDNLHQNTRDGINALVGNGCEADSGNIDEQCARTLARFLANNDQMNSLDGVSTVTTHTIAFNADQGLAKTFMMEVAAAGGGQYQLASTGAELVTAINEILRHIIVTNTTFTTPGATVNQFNRLNHRNEIYFSLFRPDANPKWIGNLKRYQVAGDPPVIVDQNKEYAVDADTGFFKSTAKSFWSSGVDGDDIGLGGAAYELPADPVDRDIYTYLPDVTGASRNLTATVNAFHETNTNITEGMINAADGTERTLILKWARGVDVHDWDEDGNEIEMRHQMGDPLHSTPAVVTYGGTDAAPDITIFFGTNEGALHAIDADDGTEEFAFVPESSFGILKKLYMNTDAYTHPYGVDGSPLAWAYDANNDNQISGAGEHVYLYFGLRRGGREYFALDVTNRAAPSVLWHIKGGQGDFVNLGQTWSKPVKTKVKIDDVVKDVLVIGGGFDPALDGSPNDRIEHTMGNAIYIVDAVTGERLWWAGKSVAAGEGLSDSRMSYAIPSEIALADINGDGLMDQIYTGDLGGQLWRFDIHHGQSASDLVTGGVMAELGADNTADFRRFFFTPDIAYVSRNGSPALAIAIGSGALNEPLDEQTTDRFYMLFQTDVFSAPAAVTTVTESDLSDRTNDLTNSSIAEAGWFIELGNSGEKSLSTPVIINNQVIFTTYEPVVPDDATCTAVAGLGRVYLMNALTANPNLDLNNSGSIDASDRSRTLRAASIPPSPKILFPAESDRPLVLVGPEQPLGDLDLGVLSEWRKVYWYEP